MFPPPSPISVRYLGLCTDGDCISDLRKAGPQGRDEEPGPKGLRPAETPISAAAGQSTSKSPNRGPTGTANGRMPEAPPAVQAHSINWVGGHGTLGVPNPRLPSPPSPRVQPPRSPASLGLGAATLATALATALARSRLPGPTWGRGDSPGNGSTPSHSPSPPACRLRPCRHIAGWLVNTCRGSAHHVGLEAWPIRCAEGLSLRRARVRGRGQGGRKPKRALGSGAGGSLWCETPSGEIKAPRFS